MQNEVEKQFNTNPSSVTGSPGGAQPALSFEEKQLIDSCSVHVANVIFRFYFFYYFLRWIIMQQLINLKSIFEVAEALLVLLSY